MTAGVVRLTPSWEERPNLGEDQLNFRAISASMDRLDLEINPPADRWVCCEATEWSNMIRPENGAKNCSISESNHIGPPCIYRVFPTVKHTFAYKPRVRCSETELMLLWSALTLLPGLRRALLLVDAQLVPDVGVRGLWHSEFSYFLFVCWASTSDFGGLQNSK